MTSKVLGTISGRSFRLLAVAIVALTLAGCSGFNLFAPAKLKEEVIVPPEALYQQALDEMDAQRYATAVKLLEKLDRQHPNSPVTEKSKLMQTFADYRIGKFDRAILAADRYLALYPNGKDADYVMWLRATSLFAQIKDATRDQQLSRDSIDAYTLLIQTYPTSEYAKDAKEKLLVGVDNLAAKEMSVGRYYLGNQQYAAAINRFRTVVEQYQTSTHIEEALFRLTEANLSLGLTSEARTAAAVLGHNYPSSPWYKEAFDLLAKSGLSPAVNQGSWLAAQDKKTT